MFHNHYVISTLFYFIFSPWNNKIKESFSFAVIFFTILLNPKNKIIFLCYFFFLEKKLYNSFYNYLFASGHISYLWYTIKMKMRKKFFTFYIDKILVYKSIVFIIKLCQLFWFKSLYCLIFHALAELTFLNSWQIKGNDHHREYFYIS